MKKLVAITAIGLVDDRTTLNNLRAFVEDALSSWGGQFHPDDPLFNSIEVRSLRTQCIGKLKS